MFMLHTNWSILGHVMFGKKTYTERETQRHRETQRETETEIQKQRDTETE